MMPSMSPSNPKTTNAKGHCPTCGAHRNAEVLFEYAQTNEDDETGMWAGQTVRTLKCAGCDTLYFQATEINSEDVGLDGRPKQQVTYWPAPARRRKPDWMWQLLLTDERLHSLFTETYAALNNNAYVLGAIGVRTIFDRASEKFRVPKNRSFVEKLNILHSKGRISRAEVKSLVILTDAGGAAAHRGWKPNVKQLDTLMNIVESLVHRALILDYEAKKLKKTIPRRKKKL